MLTERKKADRAQMATAVAMLAATHGATVEIEPEGVNSIHPRAVVVNIRAPRGLLVSIDFDGQSCQPDVHVVSWHMATDVDTCLADAFVPCGGVNSYHHRKATDVAEGFEALCATLDKRLAMAADGSAFDDARMAAAIARAGETAAERCARYDAWRQASIVAS